MRIALGVIAGLIAWMLAFYALAFGLAALWPDYALHGRDFFRQNLFTFTTPQALCNLLFWVLAELVAGWVALKIALHRRAVLIVAGVLFAYLAAMHLVLNWPRFPWWYNLGVVIPVVPAVLLGGWLARGALRRA